MSSMRHAVQRRNYKERAQPKEREKWGVLEKHKDYSLRAKDYNEKKRRLKILRQKAAERNPDEFHFAMMSSRTRDGGIKVAERGNQVLSHDVAKLYKTQDAAYLRTVAQRTTRMREKLEQSLVVEEDAIVPAVSDGLKSERSHNHVAFVDSKAEQEEWSGVNEAKGLNSTRSTREQDKHGENIESKITKRKRRRHREATRNMLAALRKREADLWTAERELDIQRAKMNNQPAPRSTKDGVKFKIKERKR